MNKEVNEFFTLKNIIFFVAIVLFLIFLSNIVNIALMFFGAYVISATLNPLIDKCEKYMPRILATALVCLLGIGIILLIIIPLFVLTIKEGANLFSNLPAFLKDIETSLSSIKIAGLDFSRVFDAEKIYSLSANLPIQIFSQGIEITKIIASGVTTTIAVSIIVFYICYDKKLLKQRFVALFPERFKEKASIILGDITKKVGGFVMAQVIAMLFVGILTCIGLAFLGSEHAILLGFVAFALDIVPAVGPTLAAVVAVLVSLSNGWLYVLGVILVYIIVQLLENQVLRPCIFGKFMDMHPLVIIMSLLIGAKFLGFWGVVLGPPIACVVMVITDELYIHAMNKKEEEEEKNS